MFSCMMLSSSVFCSAKYTSMFACKLDRRLRQVPRWGRLLKISPHSLGWHKTNNRRVILSGAKRSRMTRRGKRSMFAKQT